VRRLEEVVWQTARTALGESAVERLRAWCAAAVTPLLAGSPAPPSHGDGRMAPYEWVRVAGGGLIKVGCAAGEPDHTAVGRQSVAWDVAGAIVEWGMGEGDVRRLLASVRSAGGPELAAGVVAFYRMAYAGFRAGQCALAARAGEGGEAEGRRLRRAYRFYLAEFAETEAHRP
jgi:hypothetical protein